MSYDSVLITQYYDRLAQDEWARFDRSPVEEVKLAVHMSYLEKHVRTGSSVLEVGAGPGRFTRELARLGCSITVTDVSEVQLELNRARAHDEEFATSVQDWRLVDVVNLAGVSDGSFDCVLCYGGPISYALDGRDRAVSECARVLRPGGVLLLSVMSLWGTVHSALTGVLKIPANSNWQIIRTGDLTPDAVPGHGHPMHLFRARELCGLLKAFELDILDLSASNCLSTGWESELEGIRHDPDSWRELLELEIEACAQPGCVDMGTHIIAAARKSDLIA